MAKTKRTPNFKGIDNAFGEKPVESPPQDPPKETPPPVDATPEVKPQAPDASLAIHTTKPLDQSLATLKKSHKPKKPKAARKEIENVPQKKDDGRSGNGSANPPHARIGKSTWTFLPIDWFRNNKP